MEHIRNEKIRRKTNRVDSTVDRIETEQLLWYGLVMRMGGTRWPKRFLNYTPPNRRRRSRPRVSWRQNVEHHMRDRAIDTEDWQERKKGDRNAGCGKGCRTPGG